MGTRAARKAKKPRVLSCGEVEREMLTLLSSIELQAAIEEFLEKIGAL